MLWAQGLTCRLFIHRSIKHHGLCQHALLTATGRQFMLLMLQLEQPQLGLLVLFVLALHPESRPCFLASCLLARGIFVKVRLLSTPPPSVLPACFLCSSLIQVEKQARCASLWPQEFRTK